MGPVHPQVAVDRWQATERRESTGRAPARRRRSPAPSPARRHGRGRRRRGGQRRTLELGEELRRAAEAAGGQDHRRRVGTADRRRGHAGDRAARGQQVQERGPRTAGPPSGPVRLQEQPSTRRIAGPPGESAACTVRGVRYGSCPYTMRGVPGSGVNPWSNGPAGRRAARAASGVQVLFAGSAADALDVGEMAVRVVVDAQGPLQREAAGEGGRRSTAGRRPRRPPSPAAAPAPGVGGGDRTRQPRRPGAHHDDRPHVRSLRFVQGNSVSLNRVGVKTRDHPAASAAQGDGAAGGGRRHGSRTPRRRDEAPLPDRPVREGGHPARRSAPRATRPRAGAPARSRPAAAPGPAPASTAGVTYSCTTSSPRAVAGVGDGHRRRPPVGPRSARRTRTWCRTGRGRTGTAARRGEYR